MKHITIEPFGSTFLHNEEAARSGEALTAVNLRGRCRSVEVTGNPAVVASLSAGHRLVCTFNDSYVTTLGGDLFADGTAFYHCSGEVVTGHCVNRFLVVNTTDGVLIFRTFNGSIQPLRLQDAIPHLHLSAYESGEVSTDLPAYTFRQALTSWRAPLPSADVKNLTSLVSSAYRQIEETAAANGEHTRPLLARYALRMTNDQYLWMSAPVMLGHEMVKSNYRTQSEALTANSTFTGIGGATLSLPTFRIAVSVAKGIAAPWRDLIKSVDLLVTDEAETVECTQLDYRIATTSVGTKKYVAEWGLQPRSRSAIANELISGKWRVVASCTHIDELSDHTFAGWDSTRLSTSVLPGIPAYAIGNTALSETLTLEQCSVVTEHCSTEHLPTCTIEQGGRLYAGSNRSRFTSAWHPLTALEGPFSATPCTIRTIECIAGDEGDMTAISTHTYDFTPTAINPLLCAPRTAATAIRMEITSGGVTKVVECDLTPLHQSGMAAAISPNFSTRTPTVGIATDTPDTAPVLATAGVLTVSHIGNPLTTFSSQTVTGARITALAATERPIYSGGFGRHPLYVFTDQGIYVVPQTGSGAFGEAKLLSRKTASTQCIPGAGGGKIWFNSRHHQLCAIVGSKIEVVHPSLQCAEMVWNDAEDELWVLKTDGTLAIVSTNRHTSTLTIEARQLWTNGIHSLLISPEGRVCDICTETAANQSITYLSHPIRVADDGKQHITHITWNIFGNDLHLKATLWGETGARRQRFCICAISIHGNVDAPIALPVFCQSCRSIRLMIEGTAPSGTIIRGTRLEVCG